MTAENDNRAYNDDDNKKIFSVCFHSIFFLQKAEKVRNVDT